jgi:hypothetical protein
MSLSTEFFIGIAKYLKEKFITCIRYCEPAYEHESDRIREPASKDDVLEFIREIPYRMHESSSGDDNCFDTSLGDYD